MAKKKAKKIAPKKKAKKVATKKAISKKKVSKKASGTTSASKKKSKKKLISSAANKKAKKKAKATTISKKKTTTKKVLSKKAVSKKKANTSPKSVATNTKSKKADSLVPDKIELDKAKVEPVIDVQIQSNIQSEIELQKSSLKAVVSIKSDTSLDLSEDSDDQNVMTTRRVKMIERYIRQGRTWDDIEKLLVDHAIDYDMRKDFEVRKIIRHPKLGVGYITQVINNRMTVFFESGFKNLIMNYS
ncbi:MAG: hypothetical protein AB8E15_11825 [Bdellovibrionales bacterium]